MNSFISSEFLELLALQAEFRFVGQAKNTNRHTKNLAGADFVWT
jgi:hypothetical protein